MKRLVISFIVPAVALYALLAFTAFTFFPNIGGLPPDVRAMVFIAYSITSMLAYFWPGWTGH